MQIYVIVGHNQELENISARAAFTDRTEAEAYIKDPKRNWFDDRSVIVPLELDTELS